MSGRFSNEREAQTKLLAQPLLRHVDSLALQSLAVVESAWPWGIDFWQQATFH